MFQFEGKSYRLMFVYGRWWLQVAHGIMWEDVALLGKKSPGVGKAKAWLKKHREVQRA